MGYVCICLVANKYWGRGGVRKEVIFPQFCGSFVPQISGFFWAQQSATDGGVVWILAWASSNAVEVLGRLKGGSYRCSKEEVRL